MAVFWRDAARLVRAALLDDGGLQLRACRSSILAHQEAADDHRLRHRVVRRRRRHVARALPDHRAVARAQVPAVQLGHLSAAAGRDHHHGRDVRGDDAALRAVREVRADHLDLGAEGRRASVAGADVRWLPTSTRSGRRTHEARSTRCTRTATRRSRRSTACAPPASPTATSPSSAAQPMEDFEFGHMRPARPGCGGSPAAAASSAWSFATWLTRHDRDWPGRCNDRRHADRRVVAEPDHHVRADDAGRDSGDGGHAARHRRTAPAPAGALRSAR